MPSRRSFIKGGLGAFTLGLLARRGWGLPRVGPNDPGCVPMRDSIPILRIPRHPASVTVDGMPFADGWFGDSFPDGAIPFHSVENAFPPEGQPPEPTEEVDIAIVGGGISGLATAYLLRRWRPVLFELHERCGGTSQGEVWADTRYSLGGAYIIVPDEGDFLDQLYRELRLDQAYRLSEGDDPMELNDQIRFDFWTGAGLSPEEQLAFQRYAEVVAYMAEESYPEIPLPPGEDNTWILALDNRTLKEDIEDQMGMTAPPLLAAGIQSYCYSSFGAGWEELSAAAGWNFIAAEEYGRWVFPGGNSYLATRMWERLAAIDQGQPAGGARRLLRAGCRVVDVRLRPNDRIQVTWRDCQGGFRSLLARRVVMCCPKHVAKHVVQDLAQLDPEKWNAMNGVPFRAYVVANVLLEAPVALDFYDIFLLGNGQYPTSSDEAEAWSRVTDMLSGHYARRQNVPRGVLTLYWPLPYPSGRFDLIVPESWNNYATAIVPQIRKMLDLLSVPHSAVRQVRLTRWGHAMPVPLPGTIANGVADALRRPIEDRIFFVNQDNWALPAVENCLLDAAHFEPQIRAGL
ncbi:MAG: NAD(P)-binding protein [Phycisphaerae bacterium]|nr:NAD(P)-binding protein [Phycisphaerae bacterium]